MLAFRFKTREFSILPNILRLFISAVVVCLLGLEKVSTGWRGGLGLMVSTLDSVASGPGSSSGQEHCVLFLGKTLFSHSASLHPVV